MIRYRVGIDRDTGRPLVGMAHVRQSVRRLVRTLPDERVMLLGYSCDIVRSIGRNLVPAEVLDLYRRIVGAVHRWEPEYRIRRLQLLALERTGTLGLGFQGTYYPEGRLGNYALAEEQGLDLALADRGPVAAGLAA